MPARRAAQCRTVSTGLGCGLAGPYRSPLLAHAQSGLLEASVYSMPLAAFQSPRALRFVDYKTCANFRYGLISVTIHKSKAREDTALSILLAHTELTNVCYVDTSGIICRQESSQHFVSSDSQKSPASKSSLVDEIANSCLALSVALRWAGESSGLYRRIKQKNASSSFFNLIY